MRVSTAGLCLLLAACGSKDDDSATVPTDGTSPTCAGDGTPSVEIGGGGRTDFVPFADGEAVDLSEQNGQLGVRYELYTTGLDTTADTVMFFRVFIDDDSTDYGATLALVCDEAVGTGWFAFFAALPSPYAESPGLLQGATVRYEAVLTDARDITATDEGTVTISISR